MPVTRSAMGSRPSGLRFPRRMLGQPTSRSRLPVVCGRHPPRSAHQPSFVSVRVPSASFGFFFALCAECSDLCWTRSGLIYSVPFFDSCAMSGDPEAIPACRLPSRALHA